MLYALKYHQVNILSEYWIPHNTEHTLSPYNTFYLTNKKTRRIIILLFFSSWSSSSVFSFFSFMFVAQVRSYVYLPLNARILTSFTKSELISKLMFLEWIFVGVVGEQGTTFYFDFFCLYFISMAYKMESINSLSCSTIFY